LRKAFNFIYILCWCCLCWGVTAAVPHAPLFTVSTSADTPLWFRIFVPLLILLIIITFLNIRLTMTLFKSKRMRFFAEIAAFILLLLCGEFVYTSFPDSAQQLSRVFFVLMLCLLTALAILLAMIIRSMTQQKSKLPLMLTVLIAASSALTVLVPNMWGLSLPELHLPGDLLSYYTGQLSLTFITISVMSVLSDKSVVIYWENVAEAKLIQPLFGSFASFTGYSIAATVCAGFSVMTGNSLGFVIFFGANILVLILLTLTMVDIYYRREQKKVSRCKLLRRVSPVYAGKNEYTEQKYQDIMLNLLYHLHQAVEDHNIPYLREVAELYGGYPECFDTEEGRQVGKLLTTTGLELAPIFAAGIAKRVLLTAQEHASVNTLENNTWREDHLLWSWLAKEVNLDAIATTDAVRAKMLKTVVERLTLLTNDILSNRVPYYSAAVKSYFPGMELAANRAKRSKAYLKDFIKQAVSSDSAESGSSREFLNDLLSVLTRLNTGSPSVYSAQAENHMILPVLTDILTTKE